jgi:predicted N-acetyltransferase YhbS
MHIRQFTRGDIPQVASIAVSAFKQDELYNYLRPGLQQHPEDFRRIQTISLRNRLVRPGWHGFVAVTGADEVVGYAFFERVRGPKDKRAKCWIRDSRFNSKSIRCVL